MKPLNIKRRASLQTDMAMKEEALSILEGMRQEELAGGYNPALAERNKRLIMGTIDDSPVAPYNTVRGSEVQGRGIAGPIKPDSNVRIHTEYGNTGDALLDTDVAQYGLRELGVNTEYLSPQTSQQLYSQWASQQRADPYTKEQSSVEHFNRSIGEYYGQQALKLAGMKPVQDVDRSFNVKRDNGRNANSTLGTDRLIETNASLLGGDVGMPAGDYRYYRPDGTVAVGDYQVSNYDSNPLDAAIRLQMIKGSRMRPRDHDQFASNLRTAAQESSNIDEALALMNRREQIPNLVTGNIKRNNPREQRYGMRAGKMMSDAPFMGQLNHNDQHRYEHVLYGLNPTKALLTTPGAGGIPTAYVDVNTGNVREYMNDNVQDARMGADGSAFIRSDLRSLLNAGVATNLSDKYPQVRQLL